MTDVGPKEAAQALNDIEQIVARVRQSRIYDIASQILIAAGVLVLAGNVANFVVPRYAGYIWITVNVLNVAIVAALATMGTDQDRRADVRRPDARRVPAVLSLSASCAAACSAISGRASSAPSGRSTSCCSTASPGFGSADAFIAIGLGIIVLTLIGYFFVEGAAFLLWMAAVNGGGLILCGLWMRRI